MKRFSLVLACFLLAGVLGAQEKMKDDKKMGMMGKETTVTGEVVDLACFLKNGAKGDGHKACAEACATAGGSLAILTDDGKLYVSILPDDHKSGPNAILVDHVAHKVKATGVVRKHGGVQGIMITKVEMAKIDGMKKEGK